MEEWHTYSLVDFLMFSPYTYRSMVADYVGAYPLLQGLFLLVAAGLIRLAALNPRSRLVYAGLAVTWLVPAWLFFMERYSEIMTAAPWFAGLFVAQAILLLLAAGLPANGRSLQWGRALPLLLTGLFVQPGTSFVFGAELPVFETVGLMPDATAAFSLGMLVLIAARWWLHALPLVWCLIASLSAMAMEDPGWILPALTGLYALATLLWPSKRRIFISR